MNKHQAGFRLAVALLLVCWVAQPLFAQTNSRATFFVAKVYNDENTTPVEVTLSCNTGLPLEQSKVINPYPNLPLPTVEWVEFVVTDFDSGQMDCTVTETAVPDGYITAYAYYNSFQDPIFLISEDGCFFEDVTDGDVASSGDGFNNLCWVTNFLDDSMVEVYKDWVDDHEEFNNSTHARASWSCSNVPNVALAVWLAPQDNVAGPSGLDEPEHGNHLSFYGDPGYNYFFTYGNWNGGTVCSVNERTYDSGVEADDSDCQNIILFPGEDAECTIVNTRWYEGIPTLSQYGLAALALLMLGMGLLGFRRLA